MDVVLEEWVIYCIVAAVILLVLIPLVSALVHHFLKASNNKRKKSSESSEAPNLYTTAAPILNENDDKSLDYGSLNGTTPDGSSYVPASYNDILTVGDQGSISGSTVDLRHDPYLTLDETLTEHRSSLVLSTFYCSEPSIGGSSLATPVGSPAQPNTISPTENNLSLQD